MSTTVTEHKTIKGVVDRAFDFNGLKKVAALNSELAMWMRQMATDKVFYRKWDFEGSALLDDFWTSAADAGATEFGPPATQLLGGVLQGATGTTDNAGIGLYGTPILKGDNRAYLHTRFKLSAVTGFQMEVGFIDAITDATTPVISDVDTPANGSNGAAEIAVVHLDTDQTLTTAALVVDGSTTGMNAAKTNLGTFVPTAATYVDLKMVIDGNDVTVIIDNKRSLRATKTFAIEGGTLVMPWLYFRTRNTTSKTVDIDLIEIMGERA